MPADDLRVDLTGKVAIVTGAASGIGRATADHFARNHARVVVADIDAEGGRAAADELKRYGSDTRFVEVDVRDQAQVIGMRDAALEAFGQIDILVNNAGIGQDNATRVPIHEFSVEEWHRIIDVDLHGPFLCTRFISPHMVERKQGRIINIGSITGIVPLRLQSPYVTAKAGVIHFTKSAALELAPHGITVNAIAPGSTLSTQTRALFYSDPEKAESLLSHVPLGRPGEPEDIAAAILFLVSEAAGYMTGSVLVVDGGWICGFNRDW